MRNVHSDPMNYCFNFSLTFLYLFLRGKITIKRINVKSHNKSLLPRQYFSLDKFSWRVVIFCWFYDPLTLQYTVFGWFGKYFFSNVTILDQLSFWKRFLRSLNIIKYQTWTFLISWISLKFLQFNSNQKYLTWHKSILSQESLIFWRLKIYTLCCVWSDFICWISRIIWNLNILLL